MGIGNTSPSSVWMHLLCNIPLEDCVGAGAGLDDAGIRHKLDVLQRAVAHFHETCPADLSEHDYVCYVMRYFGGFEMVAAIGAMLQAAMLHGLILVDGFIMTACMLVASKLYPEVLPYAIFCHEGDESGHRRMLQSMGARPLLQLGLRLGEGTGAVCAYPIIESSVRMLKEMNTFEGADITKYF
jgi:nicotinate-nucleotide--dimethylbenzimidazole phosphoribosyltransferase